MHVGTQVLEVSTLFIVVKVEVGGWGGVRLPTACGLPFFASIVLVLRTLEVVRRWATKQQAYTNQACLIPTRPFRPRETTTIRSPLSFPPRTLPEPSPNPPPPHTRLSVSLTVAFSPSFSRTCCMYPLYLAHMSPSPSLISSAWCALSSKKMPDTHRPYQSCGVEGAPQRKGRYTPKYVG